jgi:hypothetical protein
MNHQQLPLNNCLAKYVINSSNLLELTNEQLDPNVTKTLELIDYESHYIYSLVKLTPPNAISIGERGIGKFKKILDKTYLVRLRPITLFYNGELKQANVYTKPTNMVCVDNEVISLSVDPPLSLDEFFAFPYSVVYSNESGLVDAVALDDNCVLARIGSSVKSLNINDLCRATSYDSCKDAPKTKGLIIYDNADDCLKYYSGKGWRKI